MLCNWGKIILILLQMKSIVLILVSLTMLFKPLWPVADYIANYEYIVNVLCENKEKPELKCHGKCYLTKQIAKEAEQSEDTPVNPTEKIEIPFTLFCESDTKYNLSVMIVKSKQHSFDDIQYLYHRLMCCDITPPPK